MIFGTFPGRPTKAARETVGRGPRAQLIQHYSNTAPSEDGKDDRPDLATKEVSTLAAFIPRYIEGYCEANRHRPSTLAQKESNAHNHLIPNLGHKRLDRITAEDIQELKAALGHFKTSTANPRSSC